MNDSECLIDFEPYPILRNRYYDARWDDSSELFFDFEELYEKARRERIWRFAMVMRQRLLTDEESDEAKALGYELSGGDKAELSDLWFQQHRLQMLAKGVNVQ